MINKLILKQIYHLYRKQGTAVLSGYLINSFNAILSRRFRGSFSQKGEDLIIEKVLGYKKKGFYIDIGACHPERFNNTKFFYDRGWHGINVEPNPARIELFFQDRKRDINLNIGIGTAKKMEIFHEIDATGLSTFSKKEADSLLKIGYRIRKKTKIQMFRLEEVMKKYVKLNVDFMTVDAEAMDLEVLKSNNWKIYRPKLLCIETIDFIDLMTSTKENFSRKKSIDRYLLEKGYKEYFSNGLNTLYRDIQSKKI